MNTNFLISVSSAYQHIKLGLSENRNQPTINRKLNFLAVLRVWLHD